MNTQLFHHRGSPSITEVRFVFIAMAALRDLLLVGLVTFVASAGVETTWGPWTGPWGDMKDAPVQQWNFHE